MPDLTDDTLDDDLTLRQQLGQIISPDQPAPAVQPTGQMVAPQSADPRRQQLTQAIQQASAQPSPAATPIVDSPSAAPSTPTSNAPTASTPAPGQQGARDILSTLGQAPAFDQSAYKALQDRRAKDATPINPLQPQYQPGTGAKILRGVRAWFGGGPSAVLNPATYNAPNRQYQIDAAKQAAAAKQDDEQIANFKTDFDEQNKGYQRKLDTLKDVTAIQKNEDVNAIRQQYDEAREKLFTAQAALAEANKNNKETPVPKTENEALALAANETDPANKQKYTDLAKAMQQFKVQQSLASRAPREGNPVYNDWKASFKAENKRAPNAKEIADWQGRQATSTGNTQNRIDQKQDDDDNKIVNTGIAPDAEVNAAQARIDARRAQKPAAPPPAAQQAPAAAAPAPAKPVAKPVAPPPPPTTHVFSKSAWQKANPKGDVNAAAKYAQSKGYTVNQ